MPHYASRSGTRLAAPNASSLDLGLRTLSTTEFFLQTGYYLKAFNALPGEKLYVMCTNWALGMRYN